MLSDRQINKLHKQIAQGLAQVDRWQGSIDLHPLLMYPENRPPNMRQMIADEMAMSGKSELDASIMVSARTLIIFKAKRDSAQQRVDEFMSKLSRNGTPYAPPEMHVKVVESLEGELAEAERVIAEHERALAVRREHGDASGLDLESAKALSAAVIVATNNRRTALRLLGRGQA